MGLCFLNPSVLALNLTTYSIPVASSGVVAGRLLRAIFLAFAATTINSPPHAPPPPLLPKCRPVCQMFIPDSVCCAELGITVLTPYIKVWVSRRLGAGCHTCALYEFYDRSARRLCSDRPSMAGNGY